MKLGKLKKVDLRQVWKHEAYDFTNWLAEETNLSLLSDELGISIELLQTEASVGRFNVDILAQEEGTDNKIIIENQLEKTDHSHLGQLITYASGLDAETLIWIVRDVRDEHKQAIDWLNEHTDENISIFLIKMELWKVGDSIPAPKFQIISKPNDWAKTVKKSVQNGGVSGLKAQQLEFWNGFKEFAQDKSALVLQKTNPKHWYNISIGSSEGHITLTINSIKKQIAAEFYIPDSKDFYNLLLSNKPVFEEEFPGMVEWMGLEDKKASRIKISKNIDFTNPEYWNLCYTWLLDITLRLKKVYNKCNNI